MVFCGLNCYTLIPMESPGFTIHRELVSGYSDFGRAKDAHLHTYMKPASVIVEIPRHKCETIQAFPITYTTLLFLDLSDYS